jgi:hypothetical protein
MSVFQTPMILLEREKDERDSLQCYTVPPQGCIDSFWPSTHSVQVLSHWGSHFGGAIIICQPPDERVPQNLWPRRNLKLRRQSDPASKSMPDI